MKNSYLNLRASYSSVQKPKRALDPKEIKLSEYYSSSKITSSINNPNSNRHQSALRKMAELYTGSTPDFDIHSSRSRKHFSSRSESRDPLNQRPMKYSSPDDSRTIRKRNEEFNCGSRESSLQYSPVQKRHYAGPARDVVLMKGKDVPGKDRSMRKNEFNFGVSSPNTLKVQRCEGSISMRHSQRFQHTDPFALKAEPIVNQHTRTPPPRCKKRVEPNLGKAQRFYLGLPESNGGKSMIRPTRPGEAIHSENTKAGYSTMYQERLEKNKQKNAVQHFSITRQGLE